jgi:ethanolamine ammonia-lyase small subunit
MTDKQVRDIVRSVLKSELSDMPNKAEVKKIAKDEAERAASKVAGDSLTKKEVKDMIKQTIYAYHKWMWEKKGMWMNQI